MRFTPDQLRNKALLGLEEAVQETRYGKVRRTIALRFALAYLWASASADRHCFDQFWSVLQEDHMWRFSAADQALSSIYQEIGIQRSHEVGMAMWEKAHGEFGSVNGAPSKPGEPPQP
jgi:hypothetical protein